MPSKRRINNFFGAKPMRNKLELIDLAARDNSIIDVARMHVDEEYVFEWGKSDCVLWVCDYIQKIHGVDHAKDFRGKYKTEIGARRLMRAEGFRSVEALVTSYYKRKPLTFAARGDLILCPSGSLGICLGYYSYFLGAGGPIRIQTLQCKAAWGVR